MGVDWDKPKKRKINYYCLTAVSFLFVSFGPNWQDTNIRGLCESVLGCMHCKLKRDKDLKACVRMPAIACICRVSSSSFAIQISANYFMKRKKWGNSLSKNKIFYDINDIIEKENTIAKKEFLMVVIINCVEWNIWSDSYVTFLFVNQTRTSFHRN